VIEPFRTHDRGGFAQASSQTEQHLDEVYLKIDGRMVYLRRALDSEGACHAESAVLGALIGSHQGRIIRCLMEIGVASPKV
jgi:hypothetical protein